MKNAKKPIVTLALCFVALASYAAVTTEQKNQFPDGLMSRAGLYTPNSAGSLKFANSGTCTYQGSTYSKGDQICINKTVHQCGSNGWFMINKSC